MSVCCVRTIAVERWLRRLQRVDGAPLANTTKAKIRNLFSVLFNHAIRFEWLGQGRNPVTLVRQSAKRERIPEVLEPAEVQGLLLQLKSCFRLMVLLDVTTGLRRSELFALKWNDVDFSNMRLDVLRSIYLRHIGNLIHAGGEHQLRCASYDGIGWHHRAAEHRIGVSKLLLLRRGGIPSLG